MPSSNWSASYFCPMSSRGSKLSLVLWWCEWWCFLCCFFVVDASERACSLWWFFPFDFKFAAFSPVTTFLAAFSAISLFETSFKYSSTPLFWIPSLVVYYLLYWVVCCRPFSSSWVSLSPSESWSFWIGWVIGATKSSSFWCEIGRLSGNFLAILGFGGFWDFLEVPRTEVWRILFFLEESAGEFKENLPLFWSSFSSRSIMSSVFFGCEDDLPGYWSSWNCYKDRFLNLSLWWEGSF